MVAFCLQLLEPFNQIVRNLSILMSPRTFGTQKHGDKTSHEVIVSVLFVRGLIDKVMPRGDCDWPTFTEMIEWQLTFDITVCTYTVRNLDVKRPIFVDDSHVIVALFATVLVINAWSGWVRPSGSCTTLGTA